MLGQPVLFQATVRGVAGLDGPVDDELDARGRAIPMVVIAATMFDEIALRGRQQLDEFWPKALSRLVRRAGDAQPQ